MVSEARSRSAGERVAPVLTVVLAVAAAFNAIDALPVGVFYDDALYAILGKAIASGEGYRYLNIPGKPPATHYPPGYPLLLALLWRISPDFPANVALFKSVNAGLVGVVAYFTYRFARVRLGSAAWLAAVAAIIATAGIPLLVLSSAVMSEVFFLALLVPWLLVAERSVHGAGVRRATWLAMSGALLFYVRAHAIVVAPALALGYLLARNRRDAMIAIAAGIVAALPWFVWVAAHDAAIPAPLRGAYASYGAWLADGVRRNGAGILASSVRDNVETIVAILSRSFAVSQQQPFTFIAVLAVIVLAAAGCVSLYARARVTVLFVALYFAAVLVWPFSPLRFVWGVWPLVVLLLLAGIQALFAQPSNGWGGVIRWAGIAATGIVLLGTLLFNVRGYANAWWTTVSRAVTPRIQPQLEWVAARTDSDDVVAADDEGAVFLYTGRHAVPANVFTATQYFARRSSAEDADNLRAILVQLNPRYLLAWTNPSIGAAELLTRARIPALVRHDTIPGGRVYRVIR